MKCLLHAVISFPFVFLAALLAAVAMIFTGASQFMLTIASWLATHEHPEDHEAI